MAYARTHPLPLSRRPPGMLACLLWRCACRHDRDRGGFAQARLSGIPTQVVVPSVSRAAVLQGTAFTVFVEPSGATTVKPGPVFTCGSSALEYGAFAPV